MGLSDIGLWTQTIGLSDIGLKKLSVAPQSRQNARLFLQSSELGLPHLHLLTRRPVCPPPSPLVRGGGGHTRLQERGWGFQFRRGDIHCGTLGIYVLYGLPQCPAQFFFFFFKYFLGDFFFFSPSSAYINIHHFPRRLPEKSYLSKCGRKILIFKYKTYGQYFSISFY